MNIKSHLNHVLREELEQKWTVTLLNWQEAPNSTKQANMAFLKGLRNHLFHAIEEISDPIELSHAIALYQIEVRCHWSLLNLKMQNHVNTYGKVKEELMYRASCISLILEALEPFVAQSALDHCRKSLFD